MIYSFMVDNLANISMIESGKTSIVKHGGE